MLIRKHMGLTRHEALEMEHNGYKLHFVALGCVDKDFYDVYL